MVHNRIRELRKARGLTVEELAEKAELSHSHISRLETGRRRLSREIAERIAKAMTVSTAEVMDLVVSKPEKHGRPAPGLSEDASPYLPQGEASPMVPKAGPNTDPWVVKSNVLDRVGIEIGDIIYVNLSSEAVEEVKPLQCVIAQIYSDDEALKAVTVLRQFVPPSLLITNTSFQNEQPLDLDKGEAYVKGVIVGSYRPFKA